MESATTEYKGYVIRSFQTDQGRWRAEIWKEDGTHLMIARPGHGPRPSMTTEPPTFTADAAIELAQGAIDGGSLE